MIESTTLRRLAWAGLLSMGLSAFAGESATPTLSPIGRWKSIDDNSGKPKSIVRIWEENGKLRGKIETLFREPGENPDPDCPLCPDALKGAKIKGMTILWDLAPEGGWWEDGRILDPANGKIYRCRMQPLESGAKLLVRGFIGISLLGRSQVWLREP
jgi:uncharacterized protein (DUF2147 family)